MQEKLCSLLRIVIFSVFQDSHLEDGLIGLDIAYFFK